MAILFALLLTLVAQPPGPDAEVGSWYGSIDDVRYVSVVTRAAIKQSPRWHADADAPPLPPRAALRAATDALRVLTPDTSRWEARSIRLTQLLFPDAWVYIVDMERRPPLPPPAPPPAGLTGTAPVLAGGVAGSFMGAPMQIVVLMNGEAVTPRRAAR